jgi:hypothetical protein
MTLEQIFAAVKTLPPDEQHRLKEMLNTWLGEPSAGLSEAEFEQHLKDQGLLSEVPPPITDFTPYAHRRPIEVSGPPLSETILEERG